uniref:NADH-ubiquinone oxidoreductase chain 4L n=1 Tax=Heterocerus parallelus TaxID=1587350 RepID=A0A343C1I6_9COLE|nr:NADH dehydrogenase subunit 4L [Heterocerus parallelus]
MFSYLAGLLVFSLKRNHLLLMLLSLEFIVLSLYFFMFMSLSILSFDQYFSMIFVSMSVCEGALGLSVLVSMIRSFGNDYFYTFNVLC